MDSHSALSESSVLWAQEYDAVHIHWNTCSPLNMMFSARPRFCLLPVGLISKLVTTTICHTQGETMSVILQCSKLNTQKTYGFSVPDLTQFIRSGWALMMEQELHPAFICSTVEMQCLPKRLNVWMPRTKICTKNTALRQERVHIYTTLSAARNEVHSRKCVMLWTIHSFFFFGLNNTAWVETLQDDIHKPQQTLVTLWATSVSRLTNNFNKQKLRGACTSWAVVN